MKKVLSLVLAATLVASLSACGGALVDLDTPKSDELTAQYDFYPDAMNTIRADMKITPEQADEVFIILTSCGEEKNYEKAYNLLYEEYRNNYFPTLEEFEKYVKQKYPDFMSVEYNDMSRQGEYYILTVNIYNLLTNEIIEKEQKYIIKENNFLDYVLSFQVR